MRKLQRSVLHHQAYNAGGSIELFHHLWKQLRIRQGKWQFKSKRLNNQQSKAKVTMTGNKYQKVSKWQRFVNWLKKLGGKKV
jgi:hypothetical protein